ncbi:unnamed protein product [Litomosoides sigmodontis]|uniref:EF-hand domain-containing protein n=1 Tax=Litomosoides sigmodontis TaxID=42156 RepID=A0A3P6TIB3_LITSI|nr:unnamed protein product [Litomosoides sigmodontis]
MQFFPKPYPNSQIPQKKTLKPLIIRFIELCQQIFDTILIILCSPQPKRHCCRSLKQIDTTGRYSHNAPRHKETFAISPTTASSLTRMGICCSSNSTSGNNHQNDVLKEEDLRRIFKEFDMNGDGYIQKDELSEVMVRMGQRPTDDELNAMFSAADKDKDGNIDFGEFLTIAYANPVSLSLKAVFDELDVDSDGCITRSELRVAFQRMGHNLTDSDIKAIYNQVDINKDGRINFDEFCQLMARKRG